LRHVDPTGLAWRDCSFVNDDGVKMVQECYVDDDSNRDWRLENDSMLAAAEQAFEAQVEEWRNSVLAAEQKAREQAATSQGAYILKPNFDMKGSYDWHYSRNTIVINNLPDGMSQAQAIALVRGDFARFASFDKGNIASARVLGGGVAGFNLKNTGLLSKGFMSAAINDSYAMVQLARRGGVQAAYTAGAHQLQGIRTWNVTATTSGIQITTEAYERPNGILNRIGGVLLDSASDQQRVWDTYLRNIDHAYFGGSGATFQMQQGVTGPMQNPFAGFF
jgi:hypothetical protein